MGSASQWKYCLSGFIRIYAAHQSNKYDRFALDDAEMLNTNINGLRSLYNCAFNVHVDLSVCVRG